MPPTLLTAKDPPAFRTERARGASDFFLIGDHAGARIPQALGDLGVSPDELRRHIAWDIGAASVASLLSELLDATLVLQTYSRLVIDCNRPFDSPTSIVTSSERTPIPGNVALPREQIELRRREIFDPYHREIRERLAARRASGRRTLLASIHSFTPVFLDEPRRWHAGVLYNRDARLASRLREALSADGTLEVGDNEPYAVSDATDYAIPEYGEKLGLAHVEIEIRQDLIAEEPGQRAWAFRLKAALEAAAARL